MAEKKYRRFAEAEWHEYRIEKINETDEYAGAKLRKQKWGDIRYRNRILREEAIEHPRLILILKTIATSTHEHFSPAPPSS